VANFKRRFDLNPDEHFHIPQDVYDFFSEFLVVVMYTKRAGKRSGKYQNEDPVLAAEFALRVAGKMPKDWTKCIPRTEDQPTTPTASRKSAGVVTNALATSINSFLVGTADLTPSVNVSYKNKVDFQSVSTLCSDFYFRSQSTILM
jgi:Transketolase